MGQSSSTSENPTQTRHKYDPQSQSSSSYHNKAPQQYEVPEKPLPELLGVQQQQRVLSDALARTILDALPPAYQSYGRKAQWLQLYNSNTHGKSFQRLTQNITERGPTVIVIQVKESSRVLGAFCDSDWLTVAAREKQAVSNAAAKQRASREGQSATGLYQKPSNQNNVFFGAEPCFVFNAGGEGAEKVGESGIVYRSHSFANSNFMYLFDTHPQEEKIGIGMGGQPGYFGWFIDRWLEQGECKGAKCTTFQNPRLSETETWEVGVVEAYAVKPENVQAILYERGSEGNSGTSVLNKNADREADKMLLELHGVHKFDMNERPDC